MYDNTIRLTDCVELIEEMPDGYVDLTIANPPFAICFLASRQYQNCTVGRELKGYNEVVCNDDQ